MGDIMKRANEAREDRAVGQVRRASFQTSFPLLCAGRFAVHKDAGSTASEVPTLPAISVHERLEANDERELRHDALGVDYCSTRLLS